MYPALSQLSHLKHLHSKGVKYVSLHAGNDIMQLPFRLLNPILIQGEIQNHLSPAARL